MKFSRLLIFIIRIYQRIISPIKPKRIKCRFHPTCSQYAVLSIEKYGSRMGVRKTINRLRRCNPHNRDSCIDYP